VQYVVLIVLLLATPATAGTVGIVVAGDQDLQGPLNTQIDSWLRGHGHTVADGLEADGVTSLLNCLLIDDQGCAQGVVAARAKTDTVVYAEVRKSRTTKATVITLYWITKTKEPVGMRRACEECSVDLMRSTVEEMLQLITAVSMLERGRVIIHSKPEGMTVLLDNENIGVTPLERELPVGQHQLVLMHRGQRVGERMLRVQADLAAEITIPVKLPVDAQQPETRSRTLPGLALGIGGAAIAAGAILYFTSEVDDGSKPRYRDTKPLGIGVAAGGAVLVGIGVIGWTRDF
jgi:hypothetical protein